MDNEIMNENYIDLPVVPLRGLVVFPEWCFILMSAERKVLPL